jgi:aminopeptidase N
MFSSAVYYRGGMTLASLRHKIGDKKFFTLLKTWVREHRMGNATTEQFTALANKVSGQNLNGFFKTWLWDQSKPTKF